MQETSELFSQPPAKALMRFRIINFIAFLREMTGLPLQEALRRASEETWPDHNGRKFSEGTLEDWWYAYAKHGFAALVPKGCTDRGRSLVLSKDDRISIITFLKDHPEYNARHIHSWLVQQRAPAKVPGYKTVLRYVIHGD